MSPRRATIIGLVVTSLTAVTCGGKTGRDGTGDAAAGVGGFGDAPGGAAGGGDLEGGRGGATGAAAGEAGRGGAATGASAGAYPGGAGDSCPGGTTLCADGCTDLLTDTGHCGECGNRCPRNEVCYQGQCVCSSGRGFARCDGACVDLNRDPNHCGACGAACPTEDCVLGRCCGGELRPSCCGGLDCNGESCCTSILVPGGSFPMGRGSETCTGCVDGCPADTLCDDREQPEHPATLTGFYLDKYEVTVSRYRRFMEAFGAGWLPSEGDGANPAVESAQGLPPGATGWRAEWNSDWEAPPGVAPRPFDALSALENRIIDCYGDNWSREAGDDEAYPMNCVNWYEAFVFCIWDGGRLPTEAEWEYAAAGGDENRLYPWGNDISKPLPANYDEQLANPLLVVGSVPAGNGRWGHADLAGSVTEWAYDWFRDAYYTETAAGCTDCASTVPGTGAGHVARGGSWHRPDRSLRAADRWADAAGHFLDVGLRCAYPVMAVDR